MSGTSLRWTITGCPSGNISCWILKIPVPFAKRKQISTFTLINFQIIALTYRDPISAALLHSQKIMPTCSHVLHTKQEGNTIIQVLLKELVHKSHARQTFGHFSIILHILQRHLWNNRQINTSYGN